MLESGHTVVCQRPRKQKKACGTQVCYLLVPQSYQIQPSVSPKLQNQIYTVSVLRIHHFTYQI